MRMRTVTFVRVVILVTLAASPVRAQLRGDVVVAGFTAPLAFVQDPSAANVQYVVEQGGRIHVVRNGARLATPFIDLSGAILAGGERGLLGLAFAPDYASSGRFFVNFTNTAGDTVVARFKRSAANPLVADPSTRFDLLWSTGERVIRQPFSNHNGGNLAFGPDGFLYIGMGDGGSGNDPNHFAQSPTSLLGKMLRINVNVPDGNTKGFTIPPGNPFASSSRPEIWSFGLRNPFRWSFDDPAHGGTGALVIGDVGQGSFEEIDYEPAGRGGQNYGWRNREGAHDNVTTLPPAFLPLVDPIFDYPRTMGASVTGGFVYRGQTLGAAFRGRYLFGDFISGRVWSLALTINASGNATASNLIDHTAQLSSPGNISSFGVDAAGELYIVSYSRGAIIRINSAIPIVRPTVVLDAPRTGNVLRQPFQVAGWAIDRGATLSSGIDTVHVWAYPSSGAAPRFVGAAQMGVSRPDVAAAFGAQFGQAGYGVIGRGLPAGSYLLVAFGLVHAIGRFDAVATATIRIVGGGQMAVDAPRSGAILTSPFIVGGWALDAGAATGTGIDAVHVWAYPVAPGTGPPRFVGAGIFGARPDVAAFFGSQFLNSGYTVPNGSLPPGAWDMVVYARSTVTGQFDTVQVVRVTVR